VLGELQLASYISLALLSNFSPNFRNRVNYLYDIFIRNFRRRNLWHLVLNSGVRADAGLAVPSPYLRWLVIHQIDHAVFLQSGQLQARELIEDLLKKNGYMLGEMKSVLDFGCGCGRIIRHFQKFEDVQWWGSDYNDVLVKWCKNNLAFANFVTNDLEPPIEFSDKKFEFIYARSVFTHLTEDQHHKWLDEMHRILIDGGLFLITVKGKDSIQWLDAAELADFKADRLVVRQERHSGENVCSSFHPESYLRKILHRHGFEIIDAVPGKTIKYMRQDAYLTRKM